MTFERACLLGDTAFVLRPHTAAATAKAAADATALAADLDDPEAALRAWEARRLEHGLALVDHGIALGKRSVERRDGSGPSARTSREAAERFGGIAQPQRRE